MSELLRFNSWLGFADAVRYAAHIGLVEDKLDFLMAYKALGYPLRIDFSNPPLFLLIPETEDGQQPVHGVEKRHEVATDVWATDGEWLAMRQTTPLNISLPVHQFGYDPDERVIVDFVHKFSELVPVYWVEQGEMCQIFSPVYWRSLLGESHKNCLLFSRLHIEQLVAQALGNPVAEQSDERNESPLPFCDPTHEAYAPELHTAFLLWQSLYVKREGNPHDMHTSASEKWLQKNRESSPISTLANHKSKALDDRLISVTTPLTKKPKK